MVSTEIKKRKRKPFQFEEEVLKLLRKENKELEVKTRSLMRQVSALENDRLHIEGRTVVAEGRQEALFNALRILAEQVSKTTAKGRRARQEARKVLKDLKITPPVTLGSSRVRKKKRRKRKP